MKNPFEIVSEFEQAVAEYTGAPFAVAVDNCSNALFLCCKYFDVVEVVIPSHTYLSVPMSIVHAGGNVVFDDRDWKGAYQLLPYPIWDAAKRFHRGMYRAKGQFLCLSFHNKKILPIGRGGMILTDDEEAYRWFRRARYSGRGEKFYKDDDIFMLGWNMYMTPEQAARGLFLLSALPDDNADQEEPGGYKDLKEFTVFKEVPEL